ncbi:MAG TPA: GNAT family N-acetyltransferase [Roseomonas sp.]|nr:GNAT family N-acetyltransferase [Roseomonas sp.]
MRLTLREATAADREALLEQFLGLNLYEQPLSGDRRTDPAGAAEALSEAERRVAGHGGHALVAEVDGAVVGHLFLSFERQGPCIAEDEYGHVAEFFVREPWRGRGIGRALLAEAERLARLRGVRRLMIGVLAGNHRAEALYRRQGYAPYVTELVKPLV